MWGEQNGEIYLNLTDTQWPYSYTDHDRRIVRAIVTDDEGWFYFVRVQRDDDFGRVTLIESSGGGVEAGEELSEALRRELREELGAEVEILCKLGLVSDYYNLIHRHNLNHYYLCRALSFGETRLTRDEREAFHLSTLKLRYQDALCAYARGAASPLGKLIAQRELPILRRAGAILNLESCK
ncbi:MAG: NUDIX hydrolase [Oscillospiraceae bacterium]|nr:NUDIX hydrolase [Oscillospiraceae bacterium]